MGFLVAWTGLKHGPPSWPAQYLLKVKHISAPRFKGENFFTQTKQ